MNKYIVELIGTFFLALSIGVAAGLGLAGDVAPLAFGFVLMGAIYAGGHVSGAHYNPAVTLGLFIRGRCPRKDVAPYIIAQLIGGVLAGLLIKGVFAGTTVNNATVEITPFVPGNSLPVLVAEFLFTFLLMLVILYVATVKTTEGNEYYGLAVGTTVIGGAFTVGGISLASFNPAVTASFGIDGQLAWADTWMHFFPQILGAVLATFTFKGLHPDEK
ncbi:MAG: porin [Akkermansiaceae bacterium]|nr:porin [Akkermansiaceae bacterium]NNM28016.1 porin [Akkermansiaceae bacterium]